MGNHGHQHVGQFDVHTIILLTTRFGTRHFESSGLTDELKVFWVFQNYFFGNGLLHRCTEQITIRSGLACTVHDAILGGQTGNGHLPLRSGGGQQHGLGASTQFAVLLIAVFDRVGAPSEVDTHKRVHIVAALVAKSGANLGPFDSQFFCADHGQRGFYTLPHVHAIA